MCIRSRNLLEKPQSQTLRFHISAGNQRNEVFSKQMSAGLPSNTDKENRGVYFYLCETHFCCACRMTRASALGLVSPVARRFLGLLWLLGRCYRPPVVPVRRKMKPQIKVSQLPAVAQLCSTQTFIKNMCDGRRAVVTLSVWFGRSSPRISTGVSEDCSGVQDYRAGIRCPQSRLCHIKNPRGAQTFVVVLQSDKHNIPEY